MEQQMSPEAKAFLDDLRDVVGLIEASPATTKDHYGDYMAAIAKIIPNGNKVQQVQMGVALVIAGANKAGVRSALQAMGAFA